MKKILIVDDEKIFLMMTDRILSSAYTTVCASSTEEAIELYKREKPDMVLSDLRMPGMSGYELKQKLQEEYGEQIPFMFMTADTAEEAESHGLTSVPWISCRSLSVLTSFLSVWVISFRQLKKSRE